VQDKADAKIHSARLPQVVV